MTDAGVTDTDTDAGRMPAVPPGSVAVVIGLVGALYGDPEVIGLTL